MTPEEVKENFGKTIAVKAPGMVCGYVYTEITDYDLERNTPWGKGVVETIDYENPKKQRVRKCLTQIELYDGEVEEVEEKPKRKRKRNGTNKKRKRKPTIRTRKRKRNV